MKDHQPEWPLPEIMDNIKERNKCKLNGDQNGYAFFRNKVSSMIRTAKNDMYKKKRVKTTHALSGKYLKNMGHLVKKLQTK